MTEVNERREAFKGKKMDRLGQELELARQLVAECGVELQLAVRALRGEGGEQVAKRMETEGIRLKKNGLRLKNWQPGERYAGWDGNTWFRKEEGKWLRRRLPVGIKVGAAPWLRVDDTEYGCL